MPLLSVVIITFNEERNIKRCLESIQGIADDIVVLDSFSTDATPAICRSFNVNFVQRKWEGYSATKNFANDLAKHDWVLSLDADEALSEELKASILKIKKQDLLLTCSFNRLTNYCGAWIKHCGWYPDVKIRIFDRKKIKWEGSIHEKLSGINKEEVSHITGDCLHYSYYSVEEHYRQAEKFSTLSAQAMFNDNKKTSQAKALLRGAGKFLRNYFIKAGFLDGAKGLTVCRISAYETYLKYHKLLQLQKDQLK